MKWGVVSPDHCIFGKRVASMLGLKCEPMADGNEASIFIEMFEPMIQEALRFPQMPKVIWWTGTDVRNYLSQDKAFDFGNAVHVTDTPWLVYPLSKRVHPVCFLPMPCSIESESLPYPKDPAILLYLTEHGARDNDRAKKIIREIRDIPIYVMSGKIGSPAIKEGFQDNVFLVPKIEDEERLELFKKISLYLRIMHYDGLSQLVVEMKSLGRHVFTTIPAPFCEEIHPEESPESISARIRSAIALKPANNGTDWYRTTFSKEMFLNVLEGVCGRKGWGSPIDPLPEKGPKLSVSMIVKNEEEMLARCLESVKGADEIVILDTGSTDKTPDVARRYTDRFIFGEYQWRDDFAEARNKSLEYCTGEWVLTIDADEFLEPGGIENIRRFLLNVPDDVMAIGFETIADGRAALHNSVRLYRNKPEIRWHGRIHNYLNVRANLDSGIKLFYGYSPNHAKDPDRSFRILKQVVESDPECCREKFYYAREFYYRKQWSDALDWYLEYLKTAYWKPEIEEAWLQISKCHHEMGNLEEAKKACLWALSLNADFEKALRWMGVLSDHDNASCWASFAEKATSKGVLFR